MRNWNLYPLPKCLLVYQILKCMLFLFMNSRPCLFCFWPSTYLLAHPSGRVVNGLRLRPLACWDCGFESHRGDMDVCCECWVLSGKGLCDELVTRPEKSYWLWCVVVCDLRRNLVNEETLAHLGLSRLVQTNPSLKWRLYVVLNYISCYSCQCISWYLCKKHQWNAQYTEHFINFMSLLQSSSHITTSKPSCRLVYLHKIYVLDTI